MTHPMLLQQHQKNMTFFASRYPEVHKLLLKTKHDHCQLMVDDTNGDIDLAVNGELMYNGSAIQSVLREYRNFVDEFGPGCHIKTMGRAVPGSFYLPRTAHQHLDRLISRHLPANADPFCTWQVPEFYPQLVVMGVGLGLHITHILEHHDIRHLVLFESEPAQLLMSTYVTDWQSIAEKQSSQGRDFNLSLTDYNNAYGALWNILLRKAPQFPFSTLIYNHNKNQETATIGRKILSNRHLYMPTWGQFDDEINQINHILHNLHRGVQATPSPENCKIDKPVVIVGGGPSLDRHIDALKMQRDKILIFSAGTSITALLENGIRPDLHVELESDYVTYEKLIKSRHAEVMRTIPLAAAVQCSPFLFEMFDQSVAFFKKELASAAVLAPDPGHQLTHATPTCTNAAFSLAVNYGAKDIRLIGLDFGYYDRGAHHSQASVYYEDSDIGEQLSTGMDKINNAEEGLRVVEGYHGPIQTYWVFDLARQTLEQKIRATKHVRILNHSDGAVIQGCKRHESFTPPQVKRYQPSQWVQQLMTTGPGLGKETKRKLIDGLADVEHRAEEIIREILSEPVDEPLLYIERKTKQINRELTDLLQLSGGQITLAVSGSIRQHLFTGLSLALTLDSHEQKRAFVEDWRVDLIHFIEAIIKKSQEIFCKDFDATDQRLRLTILTPLPSDVA